MSENILIFPYDFGNFLFFSHFGCVFFLFYIGVFPECGRTVIEFREFRESDKSLKHKLDSI